MTGAELAAAAEALIGAPFRLHGRDPATGLDCVGLLGAALAALGRSPVLPAGYRLRNLSAEALLPDPAAAGFVVASGAVEPGDVALFRLGPCQVHLAVAARGGGWVHAHAGLRRVALQAGPLGGPMIHRWRPAPSSEVEPWRP